MEPSPGADPGGTPIRRASGRRSKGQAAMPSTHPGRNCCVRSAGLEPSSTWSSTMSVYLLAARAQESRHPVLTRAIRRTKVEPQPCAAAKLPGQDSNLRALGSEPRRDASNPPGIAYAARGSNSVPRSKSPVHHPSCLQRLERIAGIEPAFSAWRSVALPLSYIRTGTASTRPRDGRVPGSRTRSYPAPNGVDYRLPRTRWRRPESNRLANACKARPLP
jgi:hypothetical protein